MTHPTEASRIILQEVQKLYGRHQIKGNSVWVCCPLPEHGGEKLPSLKINLDQSSKYPVGTYYCFGCGGSGSWNKLARIAHLQTLREVDTQNIYARRLERKPTKVEVESELDEIIQFNWGEYMAFDLEEDWRKIKASTLNAVGAKRIYDRVKNDHSLVFPVKVLGRCVGAIKAIQERDPNGRTYINSDGEWSKIRGLFPYDYVKGMIKRRNLHTVVLVEGPRDALRFIQCGIPAIAIIGAKSVSTTKIDLILALGCRVLICFDGDKAGVAATNNFRRMLKGMCDCDFVPVRKFQLELSKELGEDVKLDPANMPKKYLDIIKGML